MGFFDKLSKKASAAYGATAEKTAKLTKEAKLRMKINDNKSKIADIYKEIGKRVYEKYSVQEVSEVKVELEEQFNSIANMFKENEEAEIEILGLKDRRQCSNCHSEISMKDEFCPKCGAKQEVAKVVEPEVEVENESENVEKNDSEVIEVESSDEVVQCENIGEENQEQTQQNQNN